MSTLTSSDFGELKRPTTRVHAPPGGGSSWNWSDEPAAPAAPVGRKAAPAVAAHQDVEMAAAPPAPVQAQAQHAASSAVAPSAPAAKGTFRIALIKTAADSEVVDIAVQNCAEKLKQFPQLVAETFTVPSASELPYAANKLTQHGGFDGVICFGFLNTADPFSAALAPALIQAIMEISVKNIKPVMSGIFTGEPRVASVKIKSGWGADLAASIHALVSM